jgi:hypothetical protein
MVEINQSDRIFQKLFRPHDSLPVPRRQAARLGVAWSATSKFQRMTKARKKPGSREPGFSARCVQSA